MFSWLTRVLMDFSPTIWVFDWLNGMEKRKKMEKKMTIRNTPKIRNIHHLQKKRRENIVPNLLIIFHHICYELVCLRVCFPCFVSLHKSRYHNEITLWNWQNRWKWFNDCLCKQEIVHCFLEIMQSYLKRVCVSLPNRWRQNTLMALKPLLLMCVGVQGVGGGRGGTRGRTHDCHL